MFTGSPGKYVDIKATIEGFKGVIEGKYDDLPEMAFYMVRQSYSAKNMALVKPCVAVSSACLLSLSSAFVV